MAGKFYSLPDLAFGYSDLEPFISEDQLIIHHQNHHQAYITGASLLLEKLEKARKDNVDLDANSFLKSFSFNMGGHILHSLFWENLAPADKSGEPEGKLTEMLNKEFGSIERFKKEFSQAALSVEGSGWAALTYCDKTRRPLIMQIEKHNVNLFPSCSILLVLDVWEHAYYLDYKNKRSKYVDAFWNIVNWKEVEKRLG